MDGIIYITEHSSFNNIDRMLIDIEHRMFQIRFNEKVDYTPLNVKNWCEWDIIFDRFGFQYMSAQQLNSTVAFHINPTNKYWVVYKKVKDLDSNIRTAKKSKRKKSKSKRKTRNKSTKKKKYTKKNKS